MTRFWIAFPILLLLDVALWLTIAHMTGIR